MRNKIIMFAAANAMQFATTSPATAATIQSLVAPSGSCAALAADYDHAEKSLASIDADGITDNSAPRATMREIQASNQLMRATMDLTLMQARHCSLPDHAPSAGRYLSAALDCSLDTMKGVKDSPKCDRTSWVTK